MKFAVSGHGNAAHSAAQPLRLWFGLPVAIGQASAEVDQGRGRWEILAGGAQGLRCYRRRGRATGESGCEIMKMLAIILLVAGVAFGTPFFGWLFNTGWKMSDPESFRVSLSGMLCAPLIIGALMIVAHEVSSD